MFNFFCIVFIGCGGLAESSKDQVRLGRGSQRFRHKAQSGLGQVAIGVCAGLQCVREEQGKGAEGDDC